MTLDEALMTLRYRRGARPETFLQAADIVRKFLDVPPNGTVADAEPGPGLVQQIDGTLAQFRELFPELEEKADEKEGDDGT